MSRGLPSIVTPFAGDQFFWAERLRLAGVAPVAVDGRQPRAEAFARALDFVSGPEVRNRARALGHDMRAENGVADAVQTLEHIVASWRLAPMQNLREQLRHVYWIGGGSCAGKSTIACRIAGEHGLHLYSTDDVMAEHSRRSTPEDCPLLHRFIAMDMDERWVSRSPATMLETFHWYRGEGFPMILEDLLRMPAARGVLVEGFRLLPHLVKPVLPGLEHAVWLLPSPEFRRAAIERRGGSTSGFLAKTSNPERALQNLLERDRMFTDRLRRQVEELELRSIEVDSAMAEADSVDRVRNLFGL